MDFIPKNKHVVIKKTDMPSMNETLSVPMLNNSFVYGHVIRVATEVKEIEGGEAVFFPQILGTQIGHGIWLVKAEHIVAAVVQR